MDGKQFALNASQVREVLNTDDATIPGTQIPMVDTHNGGTIPKSYMDNITQIDTPDARPEVEVPDPGAFMFSEAKKFGTALQQAWGQGQDEYLKGQVGAKAIAGEISYEEAQRLIAPSRLQQLRDQELNEYEHTVGLADARNIALPFTWAARQIPNMVQGAIATGQGAVGGGLGAGALGLVTAGPPGALALAPVGATRGALTGLFLESARTMSGQLYFDLRNNGHTHEEAQALSVGAGAFMGYIETLQMKGLATAGRKALVKAMSDAKTKRKIFEAMRIMLAETGVQIVQEEMQTIAEALTQAVGRMVNSEVDIPAVQNIFENIIMTAVQTAVVSPVLLGAAKFGGHHSGSLAKGILKGLGLAEDGIAKAQIQQKEDQKVKVDEAQVQNKGDAKLLKGSVEVNARPTNIVEAEERRDAVRKELGTAMSNLEVAKLIEGNEEKATELSGVVEELRDDLKESMQWVKEFKAEKAHADIKERLQDHNKPEQENERIRQEASKTGERLRQVRLNGIVAKVERELKKIDRRIEDADKSELKEYRKETKRLQRIKTLAQSGTLKEKQLNELSKTISVKSAQSLANMAYKQIVDISLSATKNAAKEIKRNDAMIKALLLNSGISKSALAKLKDPGIIETRERLESYVKYLEEKLPELIEETAQKEAYEDLRDQLDRGRPAKVSGHKESRFARDTDVQKVLDHYEYYTRKMTAEESAERIGHVSDFFQQYFSDAADNSLTADQMLEHSILDEISNIAEPNKMPAQQLQELAAKVENIVDNGLSERKAQIVAEKNELNAFITEFGEAVQGDIENRKVDTEHGADEARLKDQRGIHGDFRRDFGYQFSSWSGKIAAVVQDAKNATKIINKLKVFDAIKHEETLKREALQSMRDELGKTTGLKESEVIKQMLQGAKDKLVISWRKIDENGNPAVDKKTKKAVFCTLHLTRNEAIQLYLQMKDTSLKRGLTDTAKGNGYTFEETMGDVSTEAAIKEVLTQRDLEMAEGLSNHYKKIFPKMAAEYKKATGLELTKEEFYSGVAKRLGANDKERSRFQIDVAEMASKAFRQKVASRPGMLESRIDSPRGLELQDAYVNAIQSANKHAHYEAWRVKSRMLNAVFTNSEIKKILELKFPNIKKSIENHLEDMVINDSVRQDKAVQYISKTMANAGYAFLSWKPQQYVKQLTAIAYFGLRLKSMENLAIGMAHFFDHMEEVNKVVAESEFLTNRYTNVDRTFFGALTNEDMRGLKKAQFTEAALYFLKLGDRHASLVGGWAVYQEALSEGKSKAEALSAMEEAINTTQSSGTLDEMNDIARNKYMRIITTFMQQPTRMVEYQIEAWRTAANFPTKENITSALRTTAIVHFGQGLFVAADVAFMSLMAQVGMADKDDVEKAIGRMYDEFILGPQWAVVGDVVHSAFTATVKTAKGEKLKPNDMRMDGSIFMSALKSTGFLFMDLAKASRERLSTDIVLQLVIDWARSGNVLLSKGGGVIPEAPVKFVKKLIERNSSKEKKGYRAY